MHCVVRAACVCDREIARGDRKPALFMCTPKLCRHDYVSMRRAVHGAGSGSPKASVKPETTSDKYNR